MATWAALGLVSAIWRPIHQVLGGCRISQETWLAVPGSLQSRWEPEP